MVSVRWYRWLFNGTNKINLQYLSKMVNFAKHNNIEFSVVILPVRSCYTSSGYALTDINNKITNFLANLGVRCVNPIL
jgi:hypothetical protein